MEGKKPLLSMYNDLVRIIQRICLKYTIARNLGQNGGRACALSR